jgi:hypothetical protein
MNRRPTEPGKPAARVRLDGRDKMPSQNRLAVKLKAASKAAENRPAREPTQSDLDRHARMQKMEQDAMDGFTDTTRMRYMRGGKVAAEAVHKHERNMHKGKPLTKLAAGGAAKTRGVPVASREPMIKR